MAKGPDVLERSCLPAGKVFIREGEENARAYMIQVGDVASFTMEGDRRIEIERLGPGSIIGEHFLVADELATISYEALVPTTVVIITRQEFQKILSKAHKNVKTVFDHALEKIKYYERLEMKKAVASSEVDDSANALVQGLLTGLPEDKKSQYKEVVLPHINALIKAIKEVKKANTDEDIVIDTVKK